MISDDVNIHRWTRKEYETAAYAGAFEDCQVELLDGVIYDKYPQTGMHAAGLRRARRALERICPEGYQVDVLLPLDLGSRSAPTPDLAIVLQDPDDYMDGHPSHAVRSWRLQTPPSPRILISRRGFMRGSESLSTGS